MITAIVQYRLRATIDLAACTRISARWRPASARSPGLALAPANLPSIAGHAMLIWSTKSLGVSS